MYIITGAAGFIGSVLVHHFNQLGITDLLLVDEMESGDKWLNLRDLKFTSIIQPEELWDHPIWSKPLAIKGVFHMGACSDTTEMDMDFLYDNNTLYTNVLFEICARKKVPFLYASSAATYGDGEQGYQDEHKTLAKLKPLNKYGWSKQLSDEWILQQKKTPPCWFGVKFFNVFGPNEYHKGKMSSVVYHGFNQIKKDGVVKLFKSHRKGYVDGGQKRDFVYVKDVCRAMIELMKAGKTKKSLSGIYNLGTGEARTFADLATATFKGMGIKPNIQYIDMPENLREQYQYFTQADMGKLKKALPKFKFMNLEEAVGDYVKNHLMQKHPYLGV
ncbi:MAG: ADP-glyceromanno-heptose 6-epimerase [Bacteriovoracaceae bacterium]|nr:ADP-glyceromanno-heptose 6-epimerase [Bacteriovoracaceae bacterium]